MVLIMRELILTSKMAELIMKNTVTTVTIVVNRNYKYGIMD